MMKQKKKLKKQETLKIGQIELQLLWQDKPIPLTKLGKRHFHVKREFRQGPRLSVNMTGQKDTVKRVTIALPGSRTWSFDMFGESASLKLSIPDRVRGQILVSVIEVEFDHASDEQHPDAIELPKRGFAVTGEVKASSFWYAPKRGCKPKMIVITRSPTTYF